MAKTLTAVRERPWLALAVTLVTVSGLALRLFIASSPMGEFDADEAIVGLMARHIAQGEIPAFYWGQHYGGTLEAILATPLLLLRPTSVAAVKVVPQLLHLVGVWLCYLVGRRIASKEVGLLSALLLWTWPAFSVWWSTKASGFYGATLVAGLAVWLLALRLDERSTNRDWLLLGFAAGQGWWASPQIAFLLAPAGLWLLMRKRVSLTGASLTTGAAIVGAAPWIYANLSSGWASFIAPPVPTPEPYPARLASFFAEAFPAFLGMRLQGEFGHWFLDPLGMVAFAALIGVLTAALLRYGHLLVGIALLLYPFLYAVSPLSQGGPRYLYLLGPVIALLVASAVRTDPQRALVVALAVALSGANLVAMSRGRVGTIIAPDVPVTGGLRELAWDLEETGVATFYADYWIAYPVAFYSEEEVIGTPFRGTLRNEEWAHRVRAAPGSRYVLADGSKAIDVVRQAFLAAGASYQEVDLEDFHMITSDVSVPPEAIPALQAPELGPDPKATR